MSHILYSFPTVRASFTFLNYMIIVCLISVQTLSKQGRSKDICVREPMSWSTMILQDLIISKLCNFICLCNFGRFNFENQVVPLFVQWRVMPKSLTCYLLSFWKSPMYSWSLGCLTVEQRSCTSYHKSSALANRVWRAQKLVGSISLARFCFQMFV